MIRKEKDNKCEIDALFVLIEDEMDGAVISADELDEVGLVNALPVVAAIQL